MHNKQVNPNLNLVKKLICSQLPHWKDLPLTKFFSSGTDHSIFRLGEDMYVRLPLIKSVQTQMKKEQLWLPKLAPHLSLATPNLIAEGQPESESPFFWSIYPWFEGENALNAPIENEQLAAQTLANFIHELHSLETKNAPLPGEHNFFRGVPLKYRDLDTQNALKLLHKSEGSSHELLKIWKQSVDSSPWSQEPVWIHGDIHPGNLLTHKGKVTAIIDFGGLGLGALTVSLEPN